MPDHLTPIERDGRRLRWTAEADTQLRALRGNGASLSAIAQALDISRNAVLDRSGQLKLAPPGQHRATLARMASDPEPDRESLPPGHPTAWAILTDGTLLHGAPYGLQRPDHAPEAS